MCMINVNKHDYFGKHLYIKITISSISLTILETDLYCV